MRRREIGELEFETSGYTLVNAEVSYTFRVTEQVASCPSGPSVLGATTICSMMTCATTCPSRRTRCCCRPHSVRVFGSIKLN